VAQTHFNSQVVPADSVEKYGYIWIDGNAMGPNIGADSGIGDWGGGNAATTENLSYIMPIPMDMDVTESIVVQDYVVFDGVSDNDIFQIERFYGVVAKTATTDPVHVAATTTMGTEDGALTIVEATHESRLYIPSAVTITTPAITAAQQTARDLLTLFWTITLTTMTESQFILVGSELKYTRRFV
jgi:hypothetical protein